MAMKTHKEIKKEIDFLIKNEIFGEFIIKDNTFIFDNFDFIQDKKLATVLKGEDLYLVNISDVWMYKSGREEERAKQSKSFLERVYDKKIEKLEKEQMEFINFNSKENEEIPNFNYNDIYSKNEKYDRKETKLKLIK